MRKVPNVNTHIFKQPGLPWQTASFSDAALAAFAQYDTLGDGLTDAEKAAMAAYIDAETTAGNQAKKDYETIFSLSGNNALVDYVGGKVATAVNAPTQSVNGFTFDGSTQYLNSNFTPSTDGVNLKLSDTQVESFTNDISSIGTFNCLFGVQDAQFDASNSLSINSDNPNTLSSFSVNSLPEIDLPVSITSNSLFSVLRNDSVDISIYKNGNNQITRAESENGLSINAIAVGARQRGIDSVNFLTGTLSTFMAGGVLVDQPSHYTNLTTLLTTLGAI